MTIFLLALAILLSWLPGAYRLYHLEAEVSPEIKVVRLHEAWNRIHKKEKANGNVRNAGRSSYQSGNGSRKGDNHARRNLANTRSSRPTVSQSSGQVSR